MIDIEQYRKVVGDKQINDLIEKAKAHEGKRYLMVNTTSDGGGVAEMLNSMVPILNHLGVALEWKILHGFHEFFEVTKSFHNALQGSDIDLTDEVKKLYLDTNQEFASYNKFDHDVIVIHDPQPLPLIAFFEKKQPWIWRLHIDITNPNKGLWDFVKQYIQMYDRMIISNTAYRKDDLAMDDIIIYPAIDPLTEKNRELSRENIEEEMSKHKIPLDKPIISQVSRFDIWKDPEGVIEVFRKVRETSDCRLVMCGSMASDDPEGGEIFKRVEEKARDLTESGDVIFVINAEEVFVNALQSVSEVVIQKSIREGFGLTVSEALWKGTPVVTSKVGGIPLQVKDGVNGFLCEPTDNDAFAERIVSLLNDRDLRERMGQKGKEHVRENFLITRLMSDYLDLFSSILQDQTPT
ncbi:MAG: glycosyltransferase [Thermoplasmata archaeon]|nr:glycosyltransferase [Thermoplasmata archaeon]